MLLVVLSALELVLFQDVWFIVVFPPIAAITIGMNIGLWFVLIRPRWMETRIIGMLVGSLVAALGAGLYLWLGFTDVRIGRRVQAAGPIGASLAITAAAWASSVRDQSGSGAMILRTISETATLIEYAVLVLLCIAIIWGFGSLESQIRKRWRTAAGGALAPPASIDDRAATPL
jgi:hypothetical protein